MSDSKFSIVIPTMWRYEPFVDFLVKLVDYDLVDEIILIDNDNTRRPSADVLNHSKIKNYDFGRNIFVNPAWNFGVHISKNNNVCILNDDVSFDLRLFNRVGAVLSEQTGVIGICPGLDEFKQPPYRDGSIDVIPWRGEHTFGFGCLMCVHKSWWDDIPDGLDIYYGDNWIFDSCLVKGKTNYFITNIDMHTPYASTTKEVGTSTKLDHESVLYKQTFNDYKNRIFVESKLKYQLEEEHADKQPQRITVVVPTMWRHAAFLDFVNDFIDLDVVENLIIINNDSSRTPNHPVLKNPKIKIFDFGKNIFVNPAWNLGVNSSNSNIICILNDDLNFDIRLFNRVAKFFKPNMGALGLSNGIAEYGQTPLTDGMISFEPFRGQACFGFGNLMFVHKKHWRNIPEGLDIFFGDNFIFDYNYFNQRENYFIVNLFHHHSASTTVNEIRIGDSNDSFWQRENAIYSLVKDKLIKKTF